MEIRQLISKSLERGKVDFAIWIEKDAADATPINTALVENYYQQMRAISVKTGIRNRRIGFIHSPGPDVTARTDQGDSR